MVQIDLEKVPTELRSQILKALESTPQVPPTPPTAAGSPPAYVPPPAVFTPPGAPGPMVAVNAPADLQQQVAQYQQQVAQFRSQPPAIGSVVAAIQADPIMQAAVVNAINGGAVKGVNALNDTQFAELKKLVDDPGKAIWSGTGADLANLPVRAMMSDKQVSVMLKTETKGLGAVGVTLLVIGGVLLGALLFWAGRTYVWKA